MTRGGSYGSDGFNVYHDGPSPSSLCFKVKHWDAYTCRTIPNYHPPTTCCHETLPLLQCNGTHVSITRPVFRPARKSPGSHNDPALTLVDRHPNVGDFV
ncbi:transposase [Corchorus olitorius]|uniref:Transposase n=1 Tax=Corchorus olitorius TaxID=93759 RepID=A0A1R3GIX2_9ROSI|nr:transposase [Corchorus olitorius]